MITVLINKLKLFGYHGVHKEEAIVGGQFEINISVSYEEAGKITELHETINYVNLLEITKKVFAVKSELLESVAQKIAAEIFEENKFIKNINISIEKLNAPISNFTGTVSVVFSKSY